MNTPERESSVRDLIDRVTRTIADWGKADGYFASDADAEVFYDELTAPLRQPVRLVQLARLVQRRPLPPDGGSAAPPTTTAGTRRPATVAAVDDAYKYPQGSACFIQSVSDDMEGIMKLAHAEAMLFKFGSGTGTDLSTLRSSREKLSGGGKPSGPVSFMRVYDADRQRRQVAAARPDAPPRCRRSSAGTPTSWSSSTAKTDEEQKANALIREGYDANFNGEAYSSVLFQNANLSVRVTDAFLRAAVNDEEWTTRSVTTGRPMDTYRAKDLLDKIAEGTWICGDPGVQYEDTIQKWHTCPNTAPINSSNPCSEYMFLDDSACNLSSINLMKFRRDDGTFDAERFRAACRIFITAQEILVDHASYPTEQDHRATATSSVRWGSATRTSAP